MARFHFVLIFFLCYYCLPFQSSAAISNVPTKLVNEICNQTSNYSFCVESLYSDPRTPDADAYELAYVSFGLAYLNATATQDSIAKLLKNTTAASAASLKRLKICKRDYHKAVSALEQAFNDLNSETYFQLAKLAGRAAAAADNCQSAFEGTHNYSPLATMNACLKALSGICIVVSKLFTGVD